MYTAVFTCVCTCFWPCLVRWRLLCFVRRRWRVVQYVMLVISVIWRISSDLPWLFTPGCGACNWEPLLIFQTYSIMWYYILGMPTRSYFHWHPAVKHSWGCMYLGSLGIKFYSSFSLNIICSKIIYIFLFDFSNLNIECTVTDVEIWLCCRIWYTALHCK